MMEVRVSISHMPLFATTDGKCVQHRLIILTHTCVSDNICMCLFGVFYGATMTIQQIILGFLQEGAKSGYTLKKEIVAVPFFHSTANNNQIYTALLQLHRAGLVDVALQVKERGAASKLYSITPAGERALQSWVVATPEGSAYHSHFHQQLAFAHRLSQQEIAALFAAYEAKTKTLLAIAQELQLRFGKAQQAASGDITAQRRALLWGAIFEQRRQIYELELTWLQQTRAILSALYTNSEESEQL